MRILILTPTFLPYLGGLEMGVHNLSMHLVKLGHQVIVANMRSDRPSHPEANYEVKQIRPLRGGGRFGWHLFPWCNWMEYQIRGIINNFKPDFISAHFVYPCGIWLGNINPTVPWSITCRAADVQTLEALDYGYRLRFDIDMEIKGALARASQVIVLSKHIGQVLESLGVDGQAILRIPNGADTRLRDWQSPVDIRALMKVPKDVPYILSIGRNDVKKGYDSSLAAFAKIARTFPDTYYFFIGWHTSELMPLAQTYGIADRIRTCEHLEGAELWAAYQQATLFFTPSRIEGFPNVGAEAVMAGLPVLATACPGNTDVVDPGVNGLFCRVDDIEDMARQLSALLSDAGLLKRLAQGSRERSKLFDWREIAASYVGMMKMCGAEVKLPEAIATSLRN